MSGLFFFFSLHTRLELWEVKEENIEENPNKNRRQKGRCFSVCCVFSLRHSQFVLGKCEKWNWSWNRWNVEPWPSSGKSLKKPPEHTCPTKLLESDWRRKTENRKQAAAGGKLKTQKKRTEKLKSTERGAERGALRRTPTISSMRHSFFSFFPTIFHTKKRGGGKNVRKKGDWLPRWQLWKVRVEPALRRRPTEPHRGTWPGLGSGDFGWGFLRVPSGRCALWAAKGH